MKLRKY